MEEIMDRKEDFIQDFPIDPNNYFQIYVLAVYFILQTLTTVGYGDYPGSTQFEYAFCMCLEVKLSYKHDLVHWAFNVLIYDGQYQFYTIKV